MSQWFQRFRASSSGEMSDATIQGYLRAASQIEDVWQQMDDAVDLLIGQGVSPWDAYTQKGYALAFVRACRLDIVFVQELLKANANANAGSMKYLPRVTYDQALAISEHIEPLLEEAIKASANQYYVPTSFPFPLPFGPHIRNVNQSFPLPHLQGIIAAAQQMRDWSAGLLAKYELALGAAKTPVPQAVSAHLVQMKELLQLGDFHLRTGIDMVGQISKGQVTNELSDKAEGFLWEAMESFYKLSQLIANPAPPMRPVQRVPDPDRAIRQQPYIDRRISSASPNPNTVRPVQNVPHVTLPPPAPPAPDVLSLMNQVIAEPKPVDEPPVQLTSNEATLLNQVIAGPQPTQSKPVQPPSDIAALLNQVTTGPGAAKPRQTPTPPATDAPDLLSQVTAEQGSTQILPAKPLSKKSSSGEHEQHLSNAASEDNLLDMLSEVCGEQKGSD
jgi:hypothetical protein